MKKILIILLMLSFLIYIGKESVRKTYAANSTNASIRFTDTTEITGFDGLVRRSIQGKAKSDVYEETPFFATAFEMKTDGVSSKLVNWAVETKDGYARCTLKEIAENYEKTHPGYRVVAGINADQFYTGYGTGAGQYYYYNSPYYPMIIDGERRASITPGNIKNKFIGITNGGKEDNFIKEATLDSLYLEILKDGKVISKYKVDNVNALDTKNSSSTSVFIPYKSIEANEYIYPTVPTASFVCESALLSYYSTGKMYGTEDAVFSKGMILSKKENYTLEKNTFAVTTTNTELLSYLDTHLQEGIDVRVQYYYQEEEMNECVAAFGYHSIQRENGVSISSNQPYDTSRYSRSIFGQKSDGTYVLMTVSKTGYLGLSQDETNVLLESLDVQDAYQMDGGGSTMAIVKNAYGQFEYLNASSDSSGERYILNACLFVIPSLHYEITNITRTSADLTLTSCNPLLKDIQIHLSGPHGEENLAFNEMHHLNSLAPNATYSIAYEYNIAVGDKVKHILYEELFKTLDYQVPKSGVKISDRTGTSLTLLHTLDYLENQDDKYISMNAIVNNKKYPVNLEGETIISGLQPSKVYTITLEYTIQDALTGKNYTGKDEVIGKTASTDAPVVSQLSSSREDNNLTVMYDVSDAFNAVSYLEIYINGYPYEVSLKENPNSFTCEVDQEEDASIFMIVHYQIDGKDSYLETDAITSEKLPIPPKKKGCKKNQTIFLLLNTFNVSILCAIILKNRYRK